MDVLLIPVFILFSLLVPVLAVALLLYAVPVRAAVTLVRMANRQEQVIVISWGMVAIRSSGAGSGRVTDVLILGHAVLSHTGTMETVEEHREEQAPEEAPGPAAPIPAGKLVHIVQRSIGPVGTFGSAFWRQSRFEGADGRVRLGLGDPVLTGELCGYYWASRFVLLASRIDIELEPVFDRVILELDVTVRVKVAHPLLVLFAGVNLALDPAIRDVMDFAMQRRPGGAAA